MKLLHPPDQATIDRLKETHRFLQIKGVWHCLLTQKGRQAMLAKEL